MKKDNKGFSVITVIVAIAFIGIMAMIVIYMSVSNFQMKITDLKAKDSFYTAENALDEIRAGLQKDVGEAMSNAYVEVLEAYTDENSGNVEGLDQIRQNAFQQKYLQNLYELLEDENNSDWYDMSKIKDYVDLFDSNKIDLTEESLKVVNSEGKAPLMLRGGVESGILLKNIKVIYVDPKGRASIIETDIRLGMPKVKFPTPSTLPDLMNMIVVANEGIDFGGDSPAENEGRPIHIQGSIYAGQDINEDWTVNWQNPYSLNIKDGQEVYIDKGERIVCLGEVNVGNGSEFYNNGGADLWAQGLNVTSGLVELSGKTYFSDDLTLNTAPNRSTGSTVRVSGEYYGYGSSGSAKGSYFGNNKYAKWTDTALNSAIVVNGKGSTLDLSGVSKLMLAGNSYVGTSGVPYGDLPSSTDVLTGESLTVKGNQLAYLVDSDCFKDEKYTNPMTYDDYLDIPDVNAIFDMDKSIDAWGGKSLNLLGLNPTEPVQRVFYSSVGGGFVYFYLNFSTAEAASDYFYNFYNDAEIKKNMDKYLNFYIGEGHGITMKDRNAFLRFVTKGNVLTYDGTNGVGRLEGATDANVTENQLQEQGNLQNMWYALTRKMITSYDLLNDSVKRDASDPVADHSERDANRYVFENLVDETELINFMNQQPNPYEYRFETVSGGDTLTAYVVNNKNSSPFEIDSTKAQSTRLVVATGDVVIDSGVTYSGIIMTNGRLTMMPGSKLYSAPLEAAKVFQAQRENEGEKAPMDFFWDGDKYILGNSLADDEESGDVNEKDTYDLSECITYENWKKK